MRLYITPTSPYARMARIVVLEKRLDGRVEIVPATTRVEGSAYYEINPSGRVPYLVCADGSALEDSAVICRYLDHLDGAPTLEPAPDPADPWAAQRLEASARSMLDGLAVWARELRRPGNEQSPGIIAHERERSRRMLALWEERIAEPLMHADLNHPQLALIVTLELDTRLEGFDWRGGHPGLRTWADRLGARPSIAATRVAP